MSALKYEKEINELLDIIFSIEDWMDNEEIKLFEHVRNQYMENRGKALNDKFQIGVDNGYSIEHQLELAKKMVLKEEK